MPYTRIWADVNNLQGSRDADEIDDASQETHTDLTQRFDDIIEGGAAADPWKLKGLSGRFIHLHPASGTLVTLAGLGVIVDMTQGDRPIIPGGASAHGAWIGAVPITRNAVIKEVRFGVLNTNPLTTITCSLRKHPASFVESPIIATTIAPVNATLQEVVLTGLSATVASGMAPMLEVEIQVGSVATGCVFYYASVEFDIPPT